MLELGSSLEELPRDSPPAERMGLDTLPYDLLLNIASRLDLADVHALHLVSTFFLVGDRRNGRDPMRKWGDLEEGAPVHFYA